MAYNLKFIKMKAKDAFNPSKAFIAKNVKIRINKKTGKKYYFVKLGLHCYMANAKEKTLLLNNRSYNVNYIANKKTFVDLVSISIPKSQWY